MAYDPEHRLIVSIVPGTRTIEEPEASVEDFHWRSGGRLMDLMTSDSYDAYEMAIRHSHGETLTPPRTGQPGRPKASNRAVTAGRSWPDAK